MQSNMRVFYLYIISLIALMMFIAGIISSVYNLSRLIFPDSYVFYDKEVTSQDNENIVRQNNYIKEAIKDIIVCALITVIGYVLYSYHWKTIEKERILIKNNE